MRLTFLLGILCIPLSGAASEMPDDIEAYVEGQERDQESKSLEEWMLEYGEEVPQQPEENPNPMGAGFSSPSPMPDQDNGATTPSGQLRPQNEEPPPQPQQEDFSGKNKPFTLTLVDKTQARDVAYSATACDQDTAQPLRDDGLSPDTRSGDGEYTALLAICPLGATPISLLAGSETIWEDTFALAENADAPSLRVKRTTDGVFLDDGSPDDLQPSPPSQERNNQASSSEPTGQAGSTGPEAVEGSSSLSGSVPQFVWLIIGVAIGLTIKMGQRSQSENPSSENTTPLETPERTPNTPPQASQHSPKTLELGPHLRGLRKGGHALSVENRPSQRSLSLSLANAYSQSGRVLLIAHPDNQALYPKLIPNESDVIWFRGKAPSMDEIFEAIDQSEAPIELVIVEGSASIRCSRFTARKTLQHMLDTQQPRFLLVQLEEDKLHVSGSLNCLVHNDVWELG